MSDYIDGLKRPEPGRSSTTPVQHITNITQKQDIDEETINALAEAIAKRIPSIRGGNSEITDDFDNKKSLEKLAEAMVIQREENESNFEDLGKIKETKKDKGQIERIDKTIDLLKDID